MLCRCAFRFKKVSGNAVSHVDKDYLAFCDMLSLEASVYRYSVIPQ